MNNLPENLSRKQEEQRRRSANLVLRSIAELRAEGYSIRIKDLMERTGLSRSTFSKPHVRKILISNDIVAEKGTAGNIAQDDRKKPVLHEKLRRKDEQLSMLRQENTSLREECALLRGRLFLLIQRLESDVCD